MALLIPLFAGVLFGAGLTLAQMVDPAKVLAFLDFAAIADGSWDPSLAFVMIGALAVTAIGYRLAFRLERPLAAVAFQVPTRTDLDARLIGGALIFGIGWGLAGYCPGPAVAALAFGRSETVIFVIAMLAGMTVYRLLFEPAKPAGRARQAAAR
jgi:uncharacterized membrane protein YedE/YeeE